MITLNYGPATTPAMRNGAARIWWTDTEGAERSMYLHPANINHNATLIDSLCPAGVREREWALAVSAAADRGARGETGRIAVEVRA
jgi:hypothetical protein